MRFELNLPRERGRLFLDYLNSRLRERASSYAGSEGLNEEGLFETTVAEPSSVSSEAVRLAWRVVSGLDGEVLFVEVTTETSDAPDDGWQTTAREFMTSVLAAALAEDRTLFFDRRQFHYIATQLDGEYWLPGFRLAPAYPEDPKPHLLNAEHVLTLDMNVKAIDRYDASTIAEELARRHAARLSLLLNVGLYRPSYDLLWVIPVIDGAPAQRSERCQVSFFGLGPTITEMPRKGQVCPLGRYEGSLAALYRVAGALLSMPPQARKIFRGIDSAPP